MRAHNKFNGIFEGSKEIIGLHIEFTVGAGITGPHKHGTHAGVLRGLDIRRGVADEPGLGQIDVQIIGGLLHQPGMRFPTRAGNLQL